MNTIEILTLLSYIDNHFDKKKQHPPDQSVSANLFCIIITEGRSDSHPITFNQIIQVVG